MIDYPPAIERLDDAISGAFLALAPKAGTVSLALPGGDWESFPLANPSLSPVEWCRVPCEDGFQAVKFRSLGAASMGEHFHEYPETLRQIKGRLLLTHNGSTKVLRPGDIHESKAGELHSAQYGPGGGETVCKWACEEYAVVCKVFG
jgi:hypothetical protein